MKILYIIIMLLSVDFPIGYFNNSSIKNDNDLENMIQTDKEFSRMSEEKGFPEAFIHYADENVIKMNPGSPAIIGIDELKKVYSEPLPNDKIKLKWEPYKAEISTSGDLGFTFGNWEMNTLTKTGADTVIYGVYVSIWKKQKDGSWKYILDGGNTTPKPEN
ncbi:MAG TPA: hypothetical protein PLG90_08535 [Ignavibacteria bacterium]|nr:hypothetical protein [Ignavibacteria bacterium]